MALINNYRTGRSIRTFKFAPHPEYEALTEEFSVIRDVLGGWRTVKAAGIKYLPALEGQNGTDYASYLKRANFVALANKVLGTNSGLILNKPAKIAHSKKMSDYFRTDTIGSTSFHELSRKMTHELLSMNRVGILVGIVDGKPEPEVFTTENIYNWSFDANQKLDNLILIGSDYSIDSATFERTLEYYQYHLYLENGVYTIAKYSELGILIGEPFQPAYQGKTFDSIPFTCITPEGASIDPTTGFFLDISYINLSHYTTTADLEQARHFIGSPTGYITGAQVEDAIPVGGTKFVILPEGAEIGYLELAGAGLSELTTALGEKQAAIALYSAQLVDTLARGSESSETARLRYSGEAANLADFATAIELGLQQVYSTIAQWLGVTELPSIVLNKDYLMATVTAAEITSLLSAHEAGVITAEELTTNLERGGLLEKTPVEK